jgi:DNA-binding NarL/FixJ family response regulator
MQDIFVSPLSQPITSWKQAFPDSLLIKNLTALKATHPHFGNHLAQNEPPPVCWLHLNNTEQINLPKVIADIQAYFKVVSVIVLDNVPNHETSIKALSAGVVGYAHAYSPPEVLTEIKAVVNHGGLWLGQQLLQRLIETTTKLTGNNPENVDKLLKLLTKRAREVALLASKGLSNKAIARELNITERTVKAHLAASFERLKVKDRLQLALLLNKQQTHETVDATPTLIKKAS